MANELDDEFYGRADTFIHLANEQCQDVTRGKVSASFMYAVARFNAYVSALSFQHAEQMAAARDETIDYFVKQYRAMLEENLNDYASNFDKYTRGPETH